LFLYRIHTRLMVLYVGLVVAILAAAGWTLQWVTRQSMETELGRKLEAVAGAVSVMFREEELRILLSGLGPRTEPYLREPLVTMKNVTEVKRIYFFNLSHDNLLDTEKAHDSRGSDFGLQFYRKELEGIRLGEKTHSILFTGIDGLPTMTGFAPFSLGERIVGGVGVDGSVTFLKSVENLRHRLYWIGFLGALAAVAGAAAVAATLTRPIRGLVASSARIGEGRLNEPIRSRGRSEIALLANTMEEMRRGLVDRERELKTMLAGVAHEIRNPLGGIELFTGLLSEEVADRPAAKIQADRIAREVQSLKRIVTDFLEFARPQEPKKERLPAGTLVRDAAALAAEAAKNQNVAFVIEPSLDSMNLHVDPGHFKRIALNLLHNALQAMPAGGAIRIHGSQTEETVRLCFADTGQGIPEDIRGKVFTPFFTTRDKGTGLGLPIVRKLLEVNGGAVELVRTGPEGTEFCIILGKGNRP